MVEATIDLPDGRVLGYAIYGDTAGWPVLYFHGTPSSRLELNLLKYYGVDFEQYLLRARVQLIAIDRPGMGLSSFHQNRTFVSFADDAFILTESLHISNVSVMCWSGGGPYALAVAWRYPSLVRDVSILCGFSRRFTGSILKRMGRNRWYFLSARYLPWLLRFTMNRIRKVQIRRSLPRWISDLPEPDYALVKDPAYLQKIADFTLNEACRSDAKGPVYDARMYFDDFGFDLSAIHQPVHFWWGTRDNAVIRLHAEAVEHRIKNIAVHYKEGEGHLSVYIKCFQEVIDLIAVTH